MADTPADGIPTPRVEPGEGEAKLETQPADDAADADSDDEVLVLSPFAIEEETEVERNLASITAKLSALADTARAEKQETVAALDALNTKIGALRTRQEELRASLESEVAAYNKASGKADGAADAYHDLAREVEGGDASEAVAELRRLIEFERNAISTAAKKLVCDTPAYAEYLAEFLDAEQNPDLIIDERKAGGLSFEKKQRTIKIAAFRREYEALVSAKGMFAAARDPDAIEAKKKLTDAEFDQGACDTEMMGLCQAIHNARATITDLERSIKKAGSFADSIHKKAEAVEDTSDSSAIDTARQTLKENERLVGEKTEEKAGLVARIQSTTGLENTYTRLIGELGCVLAALNAAKPLVAGAVEGGDLYEMIDEIGTDLEKYEESVLGPINSSGAVTVRPDVYYTDFMTIRTTINVDVDNMHRALVRAGERLQGLVDALSRSIATANAEDPVQLGAVKGVLAAAEKVQRFISEEWPELKAGDRETIHAISETARESVRSVLGPLEPLANFLEAGPDAWTEFQAWQALRVAEAAAAGGEEVGTESTAIAPDAGADAGTTGAGDADGTGPVATPRDPLPAVEAVEVEGGDGDDGDVDDSSDVDVDGVDDDADAVPDATPVVADSRATIKPAAADEPTTEGPKRRTTRK